VRRRKPLEHGAGLQLGLWRQQWEGGGWHVGSASV
jgi:hypothetical protein